MEQEYNGDTSVQNIIYEESSLLKFILYEEDANVYKQCKKVLKSVLTVLIISSLTIIENVQIKHNCGLISYQ